MYEYVEKFNLCILNTPRERFKQDNNSKKLIFYQTILKLRLNFPVIALIKFPGTEKFIVS